MSSKEIALEVAAFLDSAEARGLAEVGREGVRKIAEEFLAICYEELGKKPRLLDGQDVHEVLGHALPTRFAPKDPLAQHVPAVLAAYFTHLEATQVVTGVFEIRRALAETEDEYLETVRTGENAHHQVRRKEDPFVHGAAKTGRNDPCSCGSGKKFKKCHGKNA